MIVLPETVEVEVTTKCTLACPMCARTLDPDEINTRWKYGEMPVETFEKFLSHLPKEVNRISFCSAFGDAIYHTKLKSILDLCKKYNKYIDLYTNGSYRDAAWWEEISSILGEEDAITFSVDGLEDTNKIYRVNADWPSIVTGMKVIGENKLVRKRWKWILFRHNQDQIIDGFLLSKQLGIDEFLLIQSGRLKPDMAPTVAYTDILTKLSIAKEEYETKS